jgi:site-specific DNA-adenine methylase
MKVNNDLNNYECVDDSKNYYNCIYAYQNKYTKLAYIGQAKNYNKRNSQHLKANKDKDEASGSFDAVYTNPDDWYRVIIMKDLPETVLDTAEAQEIQTYGTNYVTRGYNKTKGNNMTMKKSLIASKQLDLSGNTIIEQKTWELKNQLYSLNGTKGDMKKALPHIENIQSLVDITDFYEPFAGGANISRFIAREGRFNDNITIHLNDANKLNYYKLRAVKEAPEELISAIQDYLPVNEKLSETIKINGKTLSVKDPTHPYNKKGNDIVNKIRNDIDNTEFSTYSIELAAKLFVWNNTARNLYYMIDGTTNKNTCNISKGGNGTYICNKHIYNGSTIREWSGFLNYYNTEITCMDYQDMEFGNPETSFIYCDSPYFNTAQSSTEIDMDDYTKWLSELDNNNYNFTISCNHKCIANVYYKLAKINTNMKIQTKLFYTHANSKKDKKMEDGVLYNYID